MSNGKHSFYAAAAAWSILALLLWTADTFAQGRGMDGSSWTVRSAELTALFALHDREQLTAEGTAAKPDGHVQVDGNRVSTGPAGAYAVPGTSGGAAAGGASDPSPTPQGASATTAPEGRIDINRASASELQQLPGIGPSKAKAIIDHRERSGAFQSPEELMKVKGIGEKTFERLKPRIHIGN